MRRRWKAVVVTAALLVTGTGLPGEAARPGVPVPTLSTPPAGVHGHAMWDSWYDLRPFGYREQELFVSGTATAADGTTAPYTTRIIVTRPVSASRFNGTVVLDWVNVTAQFENAVDTMEARQMLMREGFAYVHVSAQKAGLCCSPLTPQVWDPVRYAAIDHPGDQYSNDILSQVARAVRSKVGLKVRTVLAVGQSQSASKLYDYVTTTQDRARVIDGFLIHGGGKKTFPRPLSVPVLHLLSDNEAAPAAGSSDPRYRLWEVAGTAHSDFWIGYQSVFGLSGRLVDQPAKDKAGYDAIMRGDYAFAEEQFRQFIALYPKDPQAPDATNWLGEALLQRQAYDDAADVLLTGFQNYEKSARAPDLLMKLGVALAGAGEGDTACRTFAEVAKRYPKQPAAFMQRLKQEQSKAKCPA